MKPYLDTKHSWPGHDARLPRFAEKKYSYEAISPMECVLNMWCRLHWISIIGDTKCSCCFYKSPWHIFLSPCIRVFSVLQCSPALLKKPLLAASKWLAWYARAIWIAPMWDLSCFLRNRAKRKAVHRITRNIYHGPHACTTSKLNTTKG